MHMYSVINLSNAQSIKKMFYILYKKRKKMIFILILINVSQYKTNQIYYFGHLLEKCPMIYARSI